MKHVSKLEFFLNHGLFVFIYPLTIPTVQAFVFKLCKRLLN